MPNVIYHGGCHGCAQSKLGGTKKCLGCQYFDANWSLPDLNDEHERRKVWKESERERLTLDIVEVCITRAMDKYKLRITELNKHIERLENELYGDEWDHRLQRHEHIGELKRDRELWIEDMKFDYGDRR